MEAAFAERKATNLAPTAVWNCGRASGTVFGMSTCFADRLMTAVQVKGTAAMVGLDPRVSMLPSDVMRRHGVGPYCGPGRVAAAVEEFCLRVLQVVAPLVPATKVQSAFFEALGPAGFEVLGRVLHKARQLGLVTILDAKRGDIGSTAEAYAHAVFGSRSADGLLSPVWNADALTVSPYLGRDSLAPFLELARARDRGVFVLVRTSNPGATDLQERQADGEAIYRTVAGWVRDWSAEDRGQLGYGNVGAVVGATAPERLREARRDLPHAILLIPGYGAQGATAQDVVAAFDPRGLGAVVNSSRGITSFDVAAPGWEDAVATATRRMIDDLRRAGPPPDFK
jgi:orotidine-5'-phosphate decarboxylase